MSVHLLAKGEQFYRNHNDRLDCSLIHCTLISINDLMNRSFFRMRQITSHVSSALFRQRLLICCFTDCTGGGYHKKYKITSMPISLVVAEYCVVLFIKRQGMVQNSIESTTSYFNSRVMQ